MLYLEVVLGALAAIFLALLEVEFFKKNTWPKRLTYSAIVLIVLSLGFNILDQRENKKFEKERMADLKLIQLLNSSIQDLCFELQLNKVRPPNEINVDLQITNEVHTLYSTTGLFLDNFWIVHKKDSGWYGYSGTFHRFEKITCDVDTKNNTVRFVLNSFGVACDHGVRTCWEPKSVADLGKVSFQLVTGPHDTSDMKEFHFVEWCPIEKVSIYSNNFAPENLLVVADRKPKTEKQIRSGSAHYYFMPNSDLFYNAMDSTYFRIDPVNLRGLILESLK